MYPDDLGLDLTLVDFRNGPIRWRGRLPVRLDTIELGPHSGMRVQCGGARSKRLGYGRRC